MNQDQAIQSVVRENPTGWVQDYVSGEDGAINFAVGQVMELTGGSADPGEVADELRERVITDIDELDKGDEILFRNRVGPVTVDEPVDTVAEATGYRSIKCSGPQGGFIRIYQERDKLPDATGGGPIDNLRKVNT